MKRTKVPACCAHLPLRGRAVPSCLSGSFFSRSATTLSNAEQNFAEMGAEDDHRILLDSIGAQLGVAQVRVTTYTGVTYQLQQLTDWLKIPRKEIETRGGRALLRRYHSLDHALRALYPTFDWPPTPATSRRSRDHWLNPDNHKQFLDDLGQKLGVQQVLSNHCKFVHHLKRFKAHRLVQSQTERDCKTW